jgi:hypothetical protein
MQRIQELADHALDPLIPSFVGCMTRKAAEVIQEPGQPDATTRAERWAGEAGSRDSQAKRRLQTSGGNTRPLQIREENPGYRS